MAALNYVWAAPTVAMIRTITVGSATSTETFTATTGNGKVVSYTAGVGETTTTVALALLALLQASAEPEFAELTFAAGSAGNLITATGDADGRPFTLTVGGTGTISASTTTAASSPEDLGVAANYSGAALPSAGDSLTFQDSDKDVLWNLDALSGTALTTVTRRRTHTGKIALPTVSDGDYREYRATELTLDVDTLLIEQAPGDGAGQVRVNATNAAALTLTVAGDGFGAAVGSEVVEARGFFAASVVRVTGGSLALAPLAGQTTTALASVTVRNGTLRTGSGTGTITAGVFTDSQYRLASTVTTLTQDGASRGETVEAANSTTLTVDGGVLVWRSSGASLSSPKVGSDGTLDFSQAPASVAVGGTAEVYGGGSWIDGGVVTRPYNLKYTRCDTPEVTVRYGTGATVTVN